MTNPAHESDTRAGTRSRSAKRSRTGCPECRGRKVKCDERRPQCGQCLKSGRRCHIGDALFRPHILSSQDQGVTANDGQQQHHHYQRSNSGDEGGALPHAELVDDEFEATREVSGHSGTHSSWPYTPPTNTINASIDTFLVGSVQPRSAPLTETRLRLVSNDQPFSDTRPEPDKLEEAFFLRHFSEVIAPWFDLVNFQRYFGHECIVLTREHPLLRFAACSLSAKQLGQASTSSAVTFKNNAQSAIARQLLNGELDFMWYGAKYYDKAIKTLARQITPRDAPFTQLSPSISSSVGSISQSDMMMRADGEDAIVRLLSTCVLIQYESLSGNTRGWSGHLNGFDKLLALLDDGSLFYTNPLSQQIFDARSQRALRSAFWWYVINDLEESFVAQRKMRIDLDNLSLWRHMGLHMHDNGKPIDLETSPTPGAPPHLQGDLMSFSLIRTMGKIVNFTAKPSSSVQQSTHNSPQASSTAGNVNEFKMISRELDNWYGMTTTNLQPDSRWEDRASHLSSIFTSETWYSHSFRAVTMMYYYMSRMLLLIHRPPSLLMGFSDSNSTFDMLKALRNIEHELRKHAGEVIAIVNGMLDDGSVRVRAVQPLFVAGRAINEGADRRHLIEMIRAVQDDFGLICEYRVTDLLQEWGITLRSLGLEARSEHHFEGSL